jgi:hypothetical protein
LHWGAFAPLATPLIGVPHSPRTAKLESTRAAVAVIGMSSEKFNKSA